jgi:dCTP diphosphatase
MVDAGTSLGALRERVAAFVEAREWVGFHVPKDLAIAISVEAAELLEIFQWRDPGPSETWPPEVRAAVAEELADVLIYGVSLANVLRLDLSDAVLAKLAKDEAKYPVDRFRGRAP